ncbi:hypothetical protein [Acetobacter okinawensis]|uniref:hypothetical protein n=1 Tax=Acetobacter okinawensis TaxID=1076594 RepID=UPI00209EEBCD|nr:hypothetical protein [Acetobacter okinawensis]MCP1213405.1 hypothetical protein [Acetobacter okinawensis]
MLPYGANLWRCHQQVCQQAGIQVRSIGGAGDTNIQQFSVILTETAYEVIERATRLAGACFTISQTAASYWPHWVPKMSGA